MKGESMRPETDLRWLSLSTAVRLSWSPPTDLLEGVNTSLGEAEGLCLAGELILKKPPSN